MRVSLNLIKKYVDLPEDLTSKQIAYDLTLRTVEVESVENTKDKYRDIVVGKILEVRKHPNANSLSVCKVDIGCEKPVQIVCGGSNLYVDEFVVVCKPGALVVWHGEGEPVEIKETNMRGQSSYGMICSSVEVYLEELFPLKDEDEIIDLKGFDCYPGQDISSLLCMEDTIFEIDNKSLTNRPDLWGHYGIARELSAIYGVELKDFSLVLVDSKLPKYNVEIKDNLKCNRYVAVRIDGVYDKKSPLWMQSLLVNCGMRPINAIVDITNYVMLVVGQPMHAFDRTLVFGEKIVVRGANNGEKLLLLDGNEIELGSDDLVICDEKEPIALAGIRGGKKDSILPQTTGIVLEVANFEAGTIRRSGKRFDEKTESAIRYEKHIDTERVSQGVGLALELFKELFPDSKIVSYVDEYPIKTKRVEIQVSQDFLDLRLGKVLSCETVLKVLKSLGYDVSYDNGIYNVVVPVWRSTGDVSLKDDVMGDIARILSFDSFEAKPLSIKLDKAVCQNNVLLERRIREYLAYRCGMYEIFTYPWIDEKYIGAAKIGLDNLIRLATPPAPELANLRSSLIPGMLEAINKNLRYYDSFKMFEMAQVFENGKYCPSSCDEVLPLHKKYLTGCCVGKNAKDIFYEIKGVIESMSEYCHMNKLAFVQEERPGWADVNAYLNIKCNDEIVGSIGLLSLSVMNEAKIKYTNVAMFEINSDKLVAYESRTNEFKSLPQFPLVEKDLSLLVDEGVTWEQISKFIRSKVKGLEFIEEYRGNQIPNGKKSITLRIKLGNDDATMTSTQISSEISKILRTLNVTCGAVLREE